MKILTGYLAPSSGVAHIAGLDVATHRIAAAERLGYLPENGPLYPDMTPLGALPPWATGPSNASPRRTQGRNFLEQSATRRQSTDFC
jgi:ABC-2 type transport system ATP-binding protein